MNPVLLMGNPVEIEPFFFCPLDLREILINEKEYNMKLSVLFLQKEDFGLTEETKNEFTLFELYRLRSLYNEDFKNKIITALNLFTKEDFFFANENFFSNDKYLSEECWVELLKLIAEENFIDLEKIRKEEDYSPADDMARKIKEKIEANKREVEKYKKHKESSLLFLVNAFCARSKKYDLNNVWDLTFYQFKNQLDQLIKGESYDFTLQTLLVSADPKKIKIVHWTENN